MSGAASEPGLTIPILDMIVGSRKEMEEETRGTYLPIFPVLALSAAL